MQVLATEFMKNIFIFIDPAYHFLSNRRLKRHNIKSVRYGTETTGYLGSKVWNLLLEKYKEIDPLPMFI